VSRVPKSLHLELFLPRSNRKSKRAMSQGIIKEALTRQNWVMAEDSAGATNTLVLAHDDEVRWVVRLESVDFSLPGR
jgi:hypothetical protein